MSKKPLVKKSSKRKSDKFIYSSILGYEHQWTDNYQKITCGKINFDFDDFHLDILKDLWEEQITDNLTIHLLAILEQFADKLNDADKVEQTVGSLVNIYSSLSSSKSDFIRQKFLYTTTVLLICHIDLAEINSSLKQLFIDVCQLLIEGVQKPKTLIGFASAECLKEIGIIAPEFLKEFCDRNQTDYDRILIQIQLFTKLNEIKTEDLAKIVSQIGNSSSIQLHFALTQLFSVIRTEKFQELISPMIFKPFIRQFSMSNQMYQFHFALQLLRSFGLELFSTFEEQTLLNQLLIVATHPSLSISHRLLALSYLDNIMSKIKKFNSSSHSLNIKQLDITPFDGPDTQEKKLIILNKTDLDKKSLLDNFEYLKKLSLKNNRRATNAFYRVIYSFINQRDDIIIDIEDLLISVILSSPHQHIKPFILLLDSYQKLIPGTSHKFIEKLSDSQVNYIKNFDDFKEYMILIEWIMRRTDINLNESQIIDLLNLIFNQCKKNNDKYLEVLSICTAVFSKQTITPKIKETIKVIFNYLMEQDVNDISVSSMSQIYLVALNTLHDEENIKRIFCEDYDLENDLELVKDCSDNPPIVISRIYDEDKRKIENINDKPFMMSLSFEISIKQESDDDFNEIFAIVVYFDSLDGLIHEQIQVSYLQKDNPLTIQLCTSTKLNGPVDFHVSAHFNDNHGSIYKCHGFHHENVSLQDILLPINVTNSQIEHICQVIMTDSDAIETHICLKQFNNIDSFLSKYSWLSRYYDRESNIISCAIPPDRLLISMVQTVNNFLNLHVYTSNFELLPKLFSSIKK